MNISETSKILDKVSAIDNRKVTPQTLEAWHDIIGRVPFDIATEALKLAQQDASVKYLEPRHIMGWVREATTARGQARDTATQVQGSQRTDTQLRPMLSPTNEVGRSAWLKGHSRIRIG
jgi:hypothetical protein